MAEINLRDIASKITVTVTIKNETQWRWRIWLAVQLIKLAAWVAWMNVEFVENEL